MFIHLQRMPIFSRIFYFLKLCLLNINCFNILIFFHFLCFLFILISPRLFAAVVDRSILVIVDLVRYSSCLFFLVVVLSPALRLIFFGLLCSCQLLLGTMAAFLSQPSARSGRTLFGQLGRDGCYVPRLCTRCLPAHRA